jgi:lactoylglutathione lyase
MEHVTSLNARVVKKAGAADSEAVVSSFLGKSGEGKDKEFWKAVEGVAFVEDPDGYLIEVIPYSV